MTNSEFTLYKALFVAVYKHLLATGYGWCFDITINNHYCELHCDHQMMWQVKKSASAPTCGSLHWPDPTWCDWYRFDDVLIYLLAQSITHSPLIPYRPGRISA